MKAVITNVTVAHWTYRPTFTFLVRVTGLEPAKARSLNAYGVPFPISSHPHNYFSTVNPTTYTPVRLSKYPNQGT
jgi:hypothetical protein